MPSEQTPEEGVNAALQPDKGAVIPRLKLSETGYLNLKTRNGRILEDANFAFRMPNLCKVVDEMKISPPVAIGLNALRMLINRAEVYVEPFDDTPKHKQRAKFLESCLNDMESSWQTTMKSFFPFLEYGHHVSEKVFRRRLKSNGSKYNDGLVGVKALKPRPQHSIEKWNFSEDGRTLVGLSQNITSLENSYRFKALTNEDGLIEIPREKFLLFRADAVGDNPEGNSILKAAYLAFKQLSLLTDHMLIGVAKDTQGLPLVQIPPQYMSETASDYEKDVYSACKTVVDNLAAGTQRGIVFPLAYDPESKAEMFKVSLLESKGGKAYDVLAIIKVLQANILSVLSCDAVTMSVDQAGSLSLQDGDTNLLALSVAYRLGEIADTLNTDLVRQLWELNGFDTAEMPKIKFKDVSGVSLEEFSKFIQRVFSVGGMEVDRVVLNKIREVGGFDLKPDDEPIDYENLSTTLAGKATSAGEGMEVGTVGDGTSKTAVGKKDNSAANNENKA
jgi:hypothetical protein